jgi:hypothetical protein
MATSAPANSTLSTSVALWTPAMLAIELKEG